MSVVDDERAYGLCGGTAAREWFTLGSATVIITGSVTRAGTVLRPGSDEHVLTDCALRLASPLSRADLDRVRPCLQPADLPNLEWLGQLNGNRASALEQFITG